MQPLSNPKHQRVLNMIRNGRSDGASAQSMAAVLKCVPKSVREIVLQLRRAGYDVRAMRYGMGKAAYVLGEFMRADRKVIVQRDLTPGSVRDIMVKRVQAGGKAGIDGRDMAAGLSKPAVKNARILALAKHQIFGACWPGTQGRVWRYYADEGDLKQALAAARAAEREARRARDRERWRVQAADRRRRAAEAEQRTPKPRVRKPRTPLPHQVLTITQPPARVTLKEDAPIDYSRAKRTLCPSMPDTRFKVEQPTRYFSAMTPGSYAPADSWAARAYGDRA